MSSENNLRPGLPKIDILVALGIAVAALVVGFLVGMQPGSPDDTSTLVTTYDGTTQAEHKEFVYDDWNDRHDSQKKQLCTTLATSQDAVRTVVLEEMDFDFVKATWTIEAIAEMCEDVDF